MKKLTKNIPYVAAVSCLTLGIAFGPKSYPVSHTESEWGQHVAGINGVLDVIHRSDIPANTAFWCDSVLNAHKNDIYAQVLPQIKADTVKKK